jgi:hypothetical protein
VLLRQQLQQANKATRQAAAAVAAAEAAMAAASEKGGRTAFPASTCVYILVPIAYQIG